MSLVLRRISSSQDNPGSRSIRSSGPRSVLGSVGQAGAITTRYEREFGDWRESARSVYAVEEQQNRRRSTTNRSSPKWGGVVIVNPLLAGIACLAATLVYLGVAIVDRDLADHVALLYIIVVLTLMLMKKGSSPSGGS